MADGSVVEDLPLIARAFELGEVRHTAFLAAGIMNRNWRIETATGTYALKLLCDVPAELAERNAVVLDGLAAASLPVCAPLRTVGGEALLRLEFRDYLVSPWRRVPIGRGPSRPWPRWSPSAPWSPRSITPCLSRPR